MSKNKTGPFEFLILPLPSKKETTNPDFSKPRTCPERLVVSEVEPSRRRAQRNLTQISQEHEVMA
jgi:hypothetical protein